MQYDVMTDGMRCCWDGEEATHATGNGRGRESTGDTKAVSVSNSILSKMMISYLSFLLQIASAGEFQEGIMSGFSVQ
jgi:hypothetical protein